MFLNQRIALGASPCSRLEALSPSATLKDLGRSGFGTLNGESEPDDQIVLEQAEKITDRRIVFPVLSLDRGDGCEIHENADWYL